MSSSASPSPWAPFGYRAFALLWTATLISNIGTWMHEVGAGWLMTELSPSPAVVSLVQAATTGPVFLFALLAGALADRLDKRRMLIVINLGLTAVVLSLAVLVQLEAMTPGLLIFITLLVGTGAAFMAPAWQAVVPSLVPRETLQPAIALNSMGINISRAIGPALAGLLIVTVGLSAPFFLNALSHVVIIIALLAWTPEPQPARPRRPIVGELRTGLRHVAHNGPLKATLVRAAAFFVFASAYWALLPLIARSIEGGGAQLYGLLLTMVGGGAVAGALLLPQLKKRFESNAIAVLGTLGTAAAMGLLAVAALPAIAVAAAFLGGFSWIAVLTTFNVSAQTALPNWVRARGLAVFLMVFFGSMSAGAAIWGQVASATSLQVTLIVAALGLLVGILLTRRARLGSGEDMDLTPALQWPAPSVAEGIETTDGRGPVLVTVEYEIDPGDEAPFLAALRSFAEERWRDGATDWEVYQSAENPRLWIEAFRLSTWGEHLAQHERMTKHDHQLQGEVNAFDQREAGPVVRHFLGAV